MNKYYYCIDVGGTYIKCGIGTSDGKILFSSKTATGAEAENFDLCESIIKLCEGLEKRSGLSASKSNGIGIALPGLVDSTNGILKFSGNLGLKNYPILSKLKKTYSCPIKIANDADTATLAELKFGAGKTNKNFIFVSIGTGIGGGVVIGGKPLSEFANFSGEIGHIKITDKNFKCTCGESGCFEALASTKALVRLTKKSIQKNPDCLMAKSVSIHEVSGKTVFDFCKKDPIAQEVFDEYISRLGSGIVNLVNIFAPETVVIGGAISAQKGALIKPLEKYVNKHIFMKTAGVTVKLLPATKTGDSGLLGVMCQFLN